MRTRIWAGEVASSSSSDLRNPSAIPSTSSNRAAQLVFAYDVDEAVLKAMERGRLHEWTKVEFKAISRKHGLSVSGGKGELMERVTYSVCAYTNLGLGTHG